MAADPTTDDGIRKDIRDLILGQLEDPSVSLTNDKIQRDFPNYDLNVIIEVVNALLADNEIVVYTSGNNELLYKRPPKEQREREAKIQNLNPGTEYLVYQHIEDAGPDGIWVKELNYKCNLHKNILKQSLKKLKDLQLITGFKPTTSKTKQMYIISVYEIPTEENIWYTGGSFDTMAVDSATLIALKVVRDSEKEEGETLHEVFETTKRELANFYKLDAPTTSKNSQPQSTIKETDVEDVLNTLIFDDKVVVTSKDGKNYYRANLWEVPDYNGVTEMPCGTCPVSSRCTPGGVISPSTCEYMKQWLW